MTIEPTVPLDRPLDEPIAEPAHPAPRIRWAGIVWGSVFVVVAAVALGQLADASRREAIHEWLLTLTPATVSPGAVVGFVVLGLGVLLLVGGAVALLRRAQVRATIAP